jgi:hypothetical protein
VSFMTFAAAGDAESAGVAAGAAGAAMEASDRRVTAARRFIGISAIEWSRKKDKSMLEHLQTHIFNYHLPQRGSRGVMP